MFSLCKKFFMTALFGTLGLGVVAVGLAVVGGPERSKAVIQGVHSRVHAIIDEHIDDPIALRNRVKEIFAFKKSSQPLADDSAGCAFRNPIGQDGERCSAGRLIEMAGCKGLRHGSAEVSTKHANFIQADPGGSADDVFALMCDVAERVRDGQGVELRPETHLVGFDWQGAAGRAS